MASPTIENVSPGRLGRAWSKWLRFWRLLDAMWGIGLGLMLAALGLASIAILISSPDRLTREDAEFCGLGLLFGACGVYGIVTGISDLKKWVRAG